MRELFLFLLLSLSFGTQAHAGGWGSSGGGSGVACFANKTQADRAKIFVRNAKPLPAELKKQITTLETLDYWEWAQKKSFPLLDVKSKTAEGIISEMQSHTQFFASIFIYRLQQSAQIIHPADWSTKESIPRIYDAKPAHEIPDNCSQVQLAARYTKESYPLSNGPTQYSPTVAIDFDQDLYSMMTPLNQAILIIHEQMYLLGQTTGANTSDKIRPMVMLLFAAQQFDQKLRSDLVNTFGDYAMFFGEDFKAQGLPGSQESRFNSFYEILRDVRSTVRRCLESKALVPPFKTTQDRRDHKECLDTAMNPWVLQEKLNEEQSFIFLIYFVADVMQHAFNSEVVIAPIQNEVYKEISRHQIHQFCLYLKNEGNQFRIEKMVTQAQAYCANQFPMGIDQN